MVYSFFKRTFFPAYFHTLKTVPFSQNSSESPKDITFEESLRRLASESAFISFETPRFGSTLSLNPPLLNPLSASPPPSALLSPLPAGSKLRRLSWKCHREKIDPLLKSNFPNDSFCCSRCCSGPGCSAATLLAVSLIKPPGNAAATISLLRRAAVVRTGTSLVDGSGEFTAKTPGLVSRLKTLCRTD